MSAVVINLTQHPTRRVKKLVHWVLKELDVNHPSLVVKVKPSRSPVHSGRFWPHARDAWVQVWKRETGEGRLIQPSLPDGTQHLIVGRVPLLPFGMANRVKRGGPPPIVAGDWEESIVCIVAHEGMHFHQFMFPKPGRPRWSEVESEWAEYRLLKRYRERKR